MALPAQLPPSRLLQLREAQRDRLRSRCPVEQRDVRGTLLREDLGGGESATGESPLPSGGSLSRFVIANGRDRRDEIRYML